jgi:methionine biosynthesis protein MetW
MTEHFIGDAIKKHHIRFDLEIIAGLIAQKSKVLDIGCGSGELLQYLRINKNVEGRGLELAQKQVSAALGKGISVLQGDAEKDLAYYPDDSFDYAILSQTLQATKRPDEMIQQMLRIAKFAIISFPNFANLKNRLHLLFKGKMPVSKTIPFQWFDTPNIHFCSIKDFENLCANLGFDVKERVYLTNKMRLSKVLGNRFAANLFAEYGIFLITKKEVNLASQQAGQQEFVFDKKPNIFSPAPARAFANVVNQSDKR